MRNIFLILSAIIFFAAGCTTNAATGRRQLNAFSTDEEISMGAEAMPELIKQYGGRVESPQLNEYVTDIGIKLSKKTEAENPNLPWEFIVLDSDVINAFSLPGGKVFISRALMEEFSNEAQLAGVLGHEIGHVTAQHVDERITQALGFQIGLEILGAYTQSELAVAAASLFSNGYQLKYGRDQETEADTLGMRYMTEAGYDPHGMYEVMEILDEASKGNQQPEWLSTHPNPGTRMKAIQKLLDDEYAHTQNNSEYREYPGRWEREAAPYLKK